MKVKALINFIDKATKKPIQAGSFFEAAEARAKELIELGAVVEAEDPPKKAEVKTK